MKKENIIHIAGIDTFLDAELGANPALKGRPLIIGGEAGEIKKGDILAVSAEARALGLKPGRSMRKALKAVPEVTALLPRYEAIGEISGKFFALLRDSCPVVESFGPDEAFISKNLRGEAPEDHEEACTTAKKLASELQARILKDIGLHTAMGIAPNKLLARLASRRAEKDGITAVTKNEASAFIKTFPISNLPEVDREAQRLLKAINMGTVAELAKTPLLFFEKNFGKLRGGIIFESALARGPVKLEPFYEPNGISDEVTFEDGVTEASIIKETLYMLTEGLTPRLRAANDLCSAISMKITFSNFECLVNTLELEEETDSFNSTWIGASQLLEGAHLPHDRDILLVGLQLHGLRKKT